MACHISVVVYLGNLLRCLVGKNLITWDLIFVGCLKKCPNRQATEKAEFQHQGASARSPRLSSKARRPEARVSASRRVGPKPASQQQGASARSPRLNIKARRPEARVSASRRVSPKPASQHQGASARSPRLSIKTRRLDTHVSVATTRK